MCLVCESIFCVCAEKDMYTDWNLTKWVVFMALSMAFLTNTHIVITLKAGGYSDY